MGTRGDEDRFFDASEEVSSSSSSSEGFGLELWTTNPESVSDRRRKFLKSMGFSFKKDSEYSEDEQEQRQSQFSDSSLSKSVSEGINNSYGERVKAEEEEVDLLLSRNESTSSSVFDGSSVSSSDSSSLPDGLSESSSSKSINFGDSPSSVRDDLSKKGGKRSWFKKKLGVLTHVLDSIDCYESARSGITRVHTYKKQFKELSSLCIDQEFSAHDGSILSMKFSPDGKYIATAGEDCVVRVWSINEEDRTESYEVGVVDSGVYFGMNQDSQIEPLKINNNNNKEKIRTSFLRKTRESTCVVLPCTSFRISEKPVHEFVGHKGEILDLCWSKKGSDYLLSSSVDETVRLWRVGSDECLTTFSHNNFVTCVAFNPVDDNLFISGSIDGKVRIWDVSRSRVVCYTDIREIVTAVCYRPEGAVIVGSMTGNIRFYDNQLQMEREMKLGSKRIKGLEFLPNDLNKVMVTSADSQIRIVSGEEVICKLKASSLGVTSASFTCDGKHIVSTTQDSGIHVWNYSNKKIIRSYEGFLSHNASVAITWLREGSRNSLRDCITDLDKKMIAPMKVDCFSPMKGSSTTWPEEKLEEAGAMSSSRENLNLLRSAWQPHLWGLVIVTATWDGRIRVFQNYGLPIRV